MKLKTGIASQSSLTLRLISPDHQLVPSGNATIRPLKWALSQKEVHDGRLELSSV